MRTMIAFVIIVTGILVMIFGYKQFLDVVCMCPEQTVGQPSNCFCGNPLGYWVVFTGLGISLSGVAIFVINYFRKRK